MSDRLDQLKQRWEADPASRHFLQYAEELRRVGRAEEAEAVLGQGLEHHPNWIAARVSLARCRLESGHFEGAAATLEAVVRKDPTQMVAYRLLIEAYLGLGDTRSATERLELYKDLNPQDPQVELLEAQLQEQVVTATEVPQAAVPHAEVPVAPAVTVAVADGIEQAPPIDLADAPLIQVSPVAMESAPVIPVTEPILDVNRPLETGSGDSQPSISEPLAAPSLATSPPASQPSISEPLAAPPSATAPPTTNVGPDLSVPLVPTAPASNSGASLSEPLVNRTVSPDTAEFELEELDPSNGDLLAGEPVLSSPLEPALHTTDDISKGLDSFELDSFAADRAATAPDLSDSLAGMSLDTPASDASSVSMDDVLSEMTPNSIMDFPDSIDLSGGDSSGQESLPDLALSPEEPAIEAPSVQSEQSSPAVSQEVDLPSSSFELPSSVDLSSSIDLHSDAPLVATSETAAPPEPELPQPDLAQVPLAAEPAVPEQRVPEQSAAQPKLDPGVGGLFEPVHKQPVGDLLSDVPLVGEPEVLVRPVGDLLSNEPPVGSLETVMQPVEELLPEEPSVGALETVMPPVEELLAEEPPVGSLETVIQPVEELLPEEPQVGSLETVVQPVEELLAEEPPVGSLETVIQPVEELLAEEPPVGSLETVMQPVEEPLPEMPPAATDDSNAEIPSPPLAFSQPASPKLAPGLAADQQSATDDEVDHEAETEMISIDVARSILAQSSNVGPELNLDSSPFDSSAFDSDALEPPPPPKLDLPESPALGPPVTEAPAEHASVIDSVPVEASVEEMSSPPLPYEPPPPPPGPMAPVEATVGDDGLAGSSSEDADQLFPATAPTPGLSIASPDLGGLFSVPPPRSLARGGKRQTIDSSETEEVMAASPTESVVVGPVAGETGATPATATLGSLYLKQGHTREAKKIFERVLEDDPENAGAQQGLNIAVVTPTKLTASELVEGGDGDPSIGVSEKKSYVLRNYLSRIKDGSNDDVS